VQVGESIESPAMGLRVTWRELGPDVLAMDLVLKAGAPVIPMHVHPRQEERITVVSGNVRARSGGAEVVLGPGESTTTPSGQAHTIEPAGGEDAEVRAELRPALTYPDFVERSFALDRAGHVNTKGRANPLRVATAGPAEAEFFLAGVPIGVQKVLLRTLASLGRALGHDRP